MDCDKVLKQIEIDIEKASIFELFNLHKRLAVMECATLLSDSNSEHIVALLDRVQERIIFREEE